MMNDEKITKEEQLEILKEEFFENELKRQKEQQEKQLEIDIEVKQHRKVVAKNAVIQKELSAEGF